MATVTFDTLKTSRNLQAAGIAEDHAEAIVHSIAEALTDTVATKADITGLEATTKTMIESLKSEMYRALFYQGAAIVALVVGLLKLT